MTGKTLHIKNIEKYHPGYKDRHLIWFKFYFTMLDGDDEFEMIDEIDKWRFVAFTVLELKNKKPILLDEKYLIRKGFDFKKKSLQKTLDAISPFVEVCNIPVTDIHNPVTHNRVDYTKVNKNILKNNKEKYLDYVFLTQEQLKKLKVKFGDRGTEGLIENMNRYAHQIGEKKFIKKYDSHYHTILNWESKNNNPQGKQQPESKPGKYADVPVTIINNNE